MSETGMWLVKVSPEQGVMLRCFVEGTTNPALACELGLFKLGLKDQGYMIEAVAVHEKVLYGKGYTKHEQAKHTRMAGTYEGEDGA